MAAANDLNFLSQQEDHSLKSSNQNASGGVGVQVGSDGIGFYAQASAGQGSAHGNGTTHAESHVDASGTLSLVSGNDTTIQGAQLTGQQVLASVGHDLSIVSEQDTDDYASKQQQASGKVVVGYGSGASGSYSQGKVDSYYASVNEVSGIQAGAGGFDIVVGNHTGLVGGQIASTADPSQNYLSTGSLSYQDIENESKYSASQVSVSGGSSMSDNAWGGVGTALSLATPQHGNSSSTTQSGIAQGTIDVRDNPGQDLSGLNRDLPTLDGNGIKDGFDPQKIAENQELGQAAAQVGFRAAGDLAGQMGWTEGSSERTILHGIVGAAVAALGGGNAVAGGLGAAANQAAIPAMERYLLDNGYIKGTPEFATMMQLGSAALGATVSGGGGAAAALDGTKYNYLTHEQLTKVKNALLGCQLAGGDVSACQGKILADAQSMSLNNDMNLYANCIGSAGCNPDQITQATSYSASSILPAGLKNDQARSTGFLLSYLFGTDDGYKYYPDLDERKDFFQALQNGMDAKNSEVAWPQVAANVSNVLSAVNAPYCPGCGEASEWVDQVGTTIMKNEWSAFQSLYNGQTLTGDAAKQWDTNMLTSEQTMLQPLYDQLKAKGGWSSFVIGKGGEGRAFISSGSLIDIYDPNSRIEYGQQQLNDVRDQKGK